MRLTEPVALGSKLVATSTHSLASIPLLDISCSPSPFLVQSREREERQKRVAYQHHMRDTTFDMNSQALGGLVLALSIRAWSPDERDLGWVETDCCWDTSITTYNYSSRDIWPLTGSTTWPIPPYAYSNLLIHA